MGGTNREGREEKEKREKKRKKKKMEEPRSSKKVWNFGFLYGTMTLIMDSMRFGMDLWVCMMITLSLNIGF